MKKIFCKREKLLFVVCLLVVGALLFKYTIWRKAYRSLQQRESQIEDVINDIRENNKIIEAGASAVDSWALSMDQFSQKETDEATMAMLVSQVEQTARHVVCRIIQLQPQAMESLDPFHVFSLVVQVEDDLPQVLAFINQLQQAPNYFDIHAVRFERFFKNKSSFVQVEFILKQQLLARHVIDHQRLLTARNVNKDKNLEEVFSDQPSLSELVQVLKNKNLFLSFIESETPPKASDNSQPPVFTQLQLRGVLIDAEPQAIVFDKQSQKTSIVSVGDHIAQALVEGVDGSGIILSVNQKRQKILLQ